MILRLILAVLTVIGTHDVMSCWLAENDVPGNQAEQTKG